MSRPAASAAAAAEYSCYDAYYNYRHYQPYYCTAVSVTLVVRCVIALKKTLNPKPYTEDRWTLLTFASRLAAEWDPGATLAAWQQDFRTGWLNTLKYGPNDIPSNLILPILSY